MNKQKIERILNSTQMIAQNIVSILVIVMLLLGILGSIFTFASAVPSGLTITFNMTQNVTPKPAAQITTLGGSFTTVILNATTQTPRWKAYVGNVTGRMTLADSNSKSIFDWTVSSVSGEVYATKNVSIDWSTITCANQATITYEDSYLNMSQNNPDTVNKTFANHMHKMFYVGNTLILNSTCPAIATYVNGTSQVLSENASFQEILLKDGASRAIYTTLINQNTTGFNNLKYDFQMIVPENEYQSSPTPYYLYVELI